MDRDELLAKVYDQMMDDISVGDFTALEELPSELDECFCISEQVAEYEAENQEIELNEGIDSINE